MAHEESRPATSAHRTDLDFAVSGLIMHLVAQPRALPWAISCGPFRAGHLHRVTDGLIATILSSTNALSIVSGAGLTHFVPLRESGGDGFSWRASDASRHGATTTGSRARHRPSSSSPATSPGGSPPSKGSTMTSSSVPSRRLPRGVPPMKKMPPSWARSILGKGGKSHFR